MIYGPGGYKTTDFLKLGGPMQIVLWLLSVTLLVTSNASNFYISWMASFGALILTTGFMLCDFRSLFLRPEKKSQ
jgi:hypothetical protein